MIIRSGMIIFGTILVLATFVPHSFALPAVSSVYVKGIAQEYGPFSGSYIRVLAHDHSGTIIVNSDKIGIIKLNLSDSVPCFDVNEAICMSGVVVQTRHIGYPDVGDLIRLTLDPDGNKQTISFLKGDGVGSVQYINFESKSAGAKPVINTQRFFSLPEETGQSIIVAHNEDSQMSEAMAKAREFVKTHPTFSFDGIPESLEINLVSVISGNMPLYQVQADFDSTHSGYGDRTGQRVEEKTTSHTMMVMISDLGAGSAIIDGVWDEFNQNWQK